MAKFKRGQLVEVTKSSKGNKGHRFVVTVAAVAYDTYVIDNKLEHNVNGVDI